MKNVELEEEVYLLDNVCSSTTGRLMNPLLGALQRVVEIHVHKEFGSSYQNDKASHKEMANLMRGANNWNDQSLWGIRRSRLGVEYPCNGLAKLQDASYPAGASSILNLSQFGRECKRQSGLRRI